MTPRTWLSRATASGVPPSRPMRSSVGLQLGRGLAALAVDPAQDRVAGALAQARAVVVDAAHARLGGERDEVRADGREVVLAQAVALLGQHDDRAALGRLVGQRGTSAPPRRARRRATPGIAMNSDAWRLPSVIVPVLSSSSTSTSPEASTARPESASTLRRTSRSMPAMPIALSSAPIVVGMSATSSAISVVTETRRARVLGERAQRRRRRRGRSASARRAGCRARSRSGSCAARRPRRARSCGRGSSCRAPG